MALSESINTIGMLARLRDEHRKQATYFLVLFNKEKIDLRDIDLPFTPLKAFYQQQTEYHTVRAFELDEAIDTYQHAVDTILYQDGSTPEA